MVIVHPHYRDQRRSQAYQKARDAEEKTLQDATGDISSSLGFLPTQTPRLQRRPSSMSRAEMDAYSAKLPGDVTSNLGL